MRSLRKGGFKAPIIMLTGHDTDSDTILGLESGANDYVTKPFDPAELKDHPLRVGLSMKVSIDVAK